MLPLWMVMRVFTYKLTLLFVSSVFKNVPMNLFVNVFYIYYLKSKVVQFK